MGILDKLKPREALHHLQVAEGDFRGMRLHLRIEKDGSSVLIINASRVVFLNKTATDIVHGFIRGENEEQTVKTLLKRYKVKKETAGKDYRETLFAVNSLAKAPDVCPVSYLNVKKIAPFEKELSAPYRMDIALTYRCNNECIHCYAGGPKRTPELLTKDWTTVIDKLHALGIPQVVFTGGEPTLRDDLAQLIAYTQKIGLVSGLVTNGRKLKEKAYLQMLIDSGLDHVQITVESHDPKIHDKMTNTEGSWEDTVQGLKNALASPTYTVTNTTLSKLNIDSIDATIEFLHGLGVKHFACNSLIYSGKAPAVAETFALEEASLEPILNNIKEKTARLGMEFTWYTPTEYCEINPIQLDLGIKSCSACRINMAIEPDGTVIPCQSYTIAPLGNILKDNWKKIWNHPICLKVRERKYVPEKCHECPSLNICGGGCPLKIENQTK
ncbi:MAG TPA: radical SAM protein [Candidatus Nanoarchaeia archaeon]|nr:radical SAM protein [Candidatus Nanoarchaeia archaeon]